MNIFTRILDFVKFNGDEMEWVKFNGATIYEAWKKLIAKGTLPLTLPKCKGVDLVDYKIKGNSVQEGEPSPDTPVEIQSVGEKTSNALVFPYHNISDTTIYGITFKTNPDHSITMNGTVTQDFPRQLSANNGFVEGDTEAYTLFGCFGGSIDTYYVQTQNGFKDLGDGVVVSNINDKNIIRIFFKKGAVLDNVTIYPMLVKGRHVGNLPKYEPYGYKIPVKVRGKNIAGNWEYGWINQNGTLVERTDRMRTGYIEIDNEIYRFSGGTTYTNYTLYDENYNFIYGRGTGGNISIDNSIYNAKYIRIAHPGINVSSIQLEKGVTATEYEPYVEPITTNIYLDEPLRKVGNYTDYLDFESGKVVRNLGEYSFKGTEAFSLSGNTTNNSIVCYTQSIKPTPKINVNDGLCTIGKVANVTKMVNCSDGFFYNLNASHFLKVRTSVIPNYDDSLTDTEKTTLFKEYLANLYATGTPIKILYILATSTEETIELPTIPTFKGTTIIEVDTTIQPSNMEVEYYGKGVT